MTNQHRTPGRDRRAIPRRATMLAASAISGTALVAAGLMLLGTGVAGVGPARAQAPVATPGAGLPAPVADLAVTGAVVRQLAGLDHLVFEQTVAGTAGGTVPATVGGYDGAMVLGYVFPTTLPPTSAGFATDAGILALIAAVHPDFDDTPLWDENGDGDYGNDGAGYHSHWAVLVPDERVAGGLAIKEIAAEASGEVLPPTNSGLPLYLDSPGFPVLLDGDTVRIILPTSRAGGSADFTFDAVTAGITITPNDESRPSWGVDRVYGILSGDLSLPYAVEPE